MASDFTIAFLQRSDAINVKTGLSNLSTSLQESFKYKPLSSFEFSTLSTQLRTLEVLLKLVRFDCEIFSKEFFDEDFRSIICNICVPALKRIHPSFDSRRENYFLISQLCSILVACFKFTNSQSVLEVLNICDEAFVLYTSEISSTIDRTQPALDVLDIQCGLEILKTFLNTYNPAWYSCRSSSDGLTQIQRKLDVTFVRLLDIFYQSESVIVVKLSLSCVSSYLRLEGNDISERLLSVWKTILKIWNEENASYKPLMILCGLANYYFPVDSKDVEFDLRKIKSFWKIVQSGIPNTNTLVRKQSVYLLKRIVDTCERLKENLACDNDAFEGDDPVFWWSKEEQSQLSKAWEDFILLVETLEEKQVHVIKPLLPRMQSLIKAASKKGLPHIHTSWLIAILKQAFIHESIFLHRWAVDVILSLDFQACPVIRQQQDQYFSGEFLLALQEPKLYIRPLGSPLGSCPDCADRLKTFLPNCCNAYTDIKSKALFLSSVLKTVCSSNWGPAPILFICQALSHVPKLPLLDKEGVYNLRRVISGNISTVTPYVRGTIQCFCAQTLINLTNLEAVAPSDFFPVLAIFNRGESLQRGTTLWKTLVEWIQEVVELKIDSWLSKCLQQLVEDLIVNYLKVDSESSYRPSDTESLQISRMFLLCADAGVLPLASTTEEKEKITLTVTTLVSHMTDLIKAINVRAYMSPVKAVKAIELLLCINEELGNKDTEVTVLVQQTLMSCLPDMLMFIQRLLSSDWSKIEDLPSIDLCCRVISLAYSESDVNDLRSIVKVATSILVHSTGLSEISMEGQIKTIGAGSLLASIATAVAGKACDLCPDVIKDICSYAKTITITPTFKRPQSYDSQKEWGRMTSRFLTNQWELIHLCLYTGSSLQQSTDVLLDVCFDCLSVGSGHTMSPLFKCIKCLLPKVLEMDNTQKVLQALQVTWSCVDEVKRKMSFWDTLTDFVSLAYQPSLFSLSGDSEITEELLKYADMILTMGEERSGMANALISQLVNIWKQDGMLHHASKFYSVIVEACTYGILKKKERQINDVCGYMDTLGSACSVNELIPNIATSDVKVRVVMTNFLCDLKPSVDQHQKFINGLLTKLTDKYRHVMKTSVGHTFINMHSHRLRERTQQIIIMLQPFINESNCREMWTFGWECLAQEPQPSVRHMLEWLILCLASRYSHFVEELWNLFSEISEKKNFTICSVMSVLSHLGPHLSGFAQIEFYSKALPQVLPWCLGHHFNTRIYGQALICKLWRQCEMLQLNDVLDKNALIKTCLTCNSDTDKNKSTKLVKKLLQNYFFGVFDFKRDYSMETIFYTLPRLSEYSDEEWITTKVFQITDPELWSHDYQSFIPLHNQSDELSTCKSGPWRIKLSDELLGEGDNGDQEVVHSDVQKKITPWRMMTPDDETMDELMNTKDVQKTDGLILVTSLIDKVPNLGGLCRTSEIFGVSEFVIGKLKYLDDKMFQSLSVTAHKWIPITEVYEDNLPEFLHQKKQEGYTLVGVEQTANSVSLTEFQFPVKTLLLLGNEKEGIPVELINSLDVCVEIPQQGVIRSLNVHVSGALLVWEYRRQQLMKDG